MDDYPIGMFDSGSGGLSLWQAVKAELPGYSIVYAGDHAHLPYGTKTKAYIQNRGEKIIRFLLSKGAKIIVVACNTATVAGIDHFRKVFPKVPIVGVVPVVKKAAEMTKTKEFTVLATSYTTKSPYQKKLIRTFASHCQVHVIGNSKLVQLIESGKGNSNKTKQILKRILSPMQKNKSDTLVLGCTHFPFVRDSIQSIVGHKIMILDSGGAVARHVRRIIEHEHILPGNTVQYAFFTTGNTAVVSRVSASFVRIPIAVEQIALP